jgi:formate dehydrogenase subunit gamma
MMNIDGVAARRPWRNWFAALCMCVWVPAVWAQGAQKPLPVDDPAPAAAAPAESANSGIRSANIFQIAPDADKAPGYLQQSNAERAAVQPGNNAPMWRALGQGGVTGTTTLPKAQAPEAGNLVQAFVQYPGSTFTNAGEAWRQVRNRVIIPYGSALLLIALGAVAIFYFTKGTIALQGAETGRKVERFTPFERSAHWANAIAFVVLATSGLVMAFGKYLLLPILGSTLFGWLTYALKTAHNIVGPLFAVSLVIVIVTFVRDNLPRRGDLTWLLKGGGMLGGEHVPSHRFNAGEKLLFWLGVLTMGALVVASGLVLNKLLPGLYYERATMQIAHMVHAVASIAMMALFIGHIYMGTLGVKGAYGAMRTGYVDETWAKEHHEQWHDDIKAGLIPARRSAVPLSEGSPATPVAQA